MFQLFIIDRPIPEAMNSSTLPLIVYESMTAPSIKICRYLGGGSHSWSTFSEG